MFEFIFIFDSKSLVERSVIFLKKIRMSAKAILAIKQSAVLHGNRRNA